MGKIDVTQMKFLRDPRHFADFWNGLAYGGEQKVRPEELMEISPVGLVDSEDRNSKKTSDMVMAKTSDGQILGVMITENQTELDYSMPVRLNLREAMEYDRQVSEIIKRNRDASQRGEKVFRDSGEYLYGFRKQDKLRPVSTLVLYWNSDEWKGPRSLYDILNFKDVEEMNNLVSDFKMNITNMDKVADIEKLFVSQDVKDVVSLFQMRSNKVDFKSYIDKHGKNINDECMKMINTLIKSTELKDYMIKNQGKKGDESDMCKAITELIEDGKIEGRLEGRSEGMLLANKLNAKLYSDGRLEDIGHASVDPEYQKKLIKEFFPNEYEDLVGSKN